MIQKNYILENEGCQIFSPTISFNMALLAIISCCKYYEESNHSFAQFVNFDISYKFPFSLDSVILPGRNL